MPAPARRAEDAREAAESSTRSRRRRQNQSQGREDVDEPVHADDGIEEYGLARPRKRGASTCARRGQVDRRCSRFWLSGVPTHCACNQHHSEPVALSVPRSLLRERITARDLHEHLPCCIGESPGFSLVVVGGARRSTLGSTSWSKQFVLMSGALVVGRARWLRVVAARGCCRRAIGAAALNATHFAIGTRSSRRGTDDTRGSPCGDRILALSGISSLDGRNARCRRRRWRVRERTNGKRNDECS